MTRPGLVLIACLLAARASRAEPKRQVLGDWSFAAPSGFVPEEVDECFIEGTATGKGKCLGFITAEAAERRRQQALRSHSRLKPKKILGAVLGKGLLKPIPEAYVTASPKLYNPTYECMTKCQFEGGLVGDVTPGDHYGHKAFLYICSQSAGGNRYYREHVLICPTSEASGIDLVYGYPRLDLRGKWLKAFQDSAGSLRQGAGATEGVKVSTEPPAAP